MLTLPNRFEVVFGSYIDFLSLVIDLNSLKLALFSMVFVIVRVKWEEDRREQQAKTEEERAKHNKKRILTYWYELATVGFIVYYIAPILVEYGLPPKFLPMFALVFGFLGMEKIISLIMQLFNSLFFAVVNKITGQDLNNKTSNNEHKTDKDK